MQQDLNNHVKTQVLTPEEIARSYPHASPPVYSYQGSFYVPIEKREEDLSFCPSRGKIINKEPMHDPNTGEVIGYKMFWQKEYEKKPPEPFLSIMLWEYEGTPEDKEREERERENVPIFNRKYRYCDQDCMKNDKTGIETWKSFFVTFVLSLPPILTTFNKP